MGTNFYFRLDNREKIKQAIDKNDFDLARELMDDCEIHIGKRSGGWLPLFQAHPGKFESVAEMKKFYEENNVAIINEYNEEFDWNGLVEELISWNGGVYGVAPREKIEQDKNSYFYDPNMPETRPISHFEYGMNSYYAKDYYKDPEGYEFTRHEFS